MTKRWIKVPGPGQFRGEGEWEDFEEFAQADPEHYWKWLNQTQYLPTLTQENKPE